MRLLLALLCHFPDAKEKLSAALIVGHMNKAIASRQKTTHLASIADDAAMRVDETQHWDDKFSGTGSTRSRAAFVATASSNRFSSRVCKTTLSGI